MIGYAVNPQLRVKVQRDAGSVTHLSLSAPVPGRGLQRNDLRRGNQGEQMDALVSVLTQLRNPAFLKQLDPGTSNSLREIGVLLPSSSLPERPRFECALSLSPEAPVVGEFSQLRLRELVRREAPASTVALGLERELQQLLPAAETRWIRYLPSGAWLPYAASGHLRAALDRALDQDRLLADLGGQGAAALLGPCGLEERLRPALSDLRFGQAAREHCSVAGLLPEIWRRAFARYYTELVHQGFWPFDDGQSTRYWSYNEPIARVLHQQLAPLFTQIAATELKPSYAYSCWYVDGARLDLHTDRPQCGYTASILIDSPTTSPDVAPWPLGIVNPETREITRVVQDRGDAVFFCGTRYPHFRARQPEGRVSCCVFLHYVTSDFAGSLA